MELLLLLQPETASKDTTVKDEQSPVVFYLKKKQNKNKTKSLKGYVSPPYSRYLSIYVPCSSLQA